MNATFTVALVMSHAMLRRLCFIVAGLSAAGLQGASVVTRYVDSPAERQTAISRGASKSYSMPVQVGTSLQQISELMKGPTHRNDENRILNIFRSATAAELNEIIARMTQHDFQKLVSDMDDRLIGPDYRTAFLNVLSKERLGDLKVENRARLIGALHYHRTSPRDERAARDVFLGTKGTDLTKLKKAIDHGDDYHDLQQLVFHDIDDSTIRAQLLDHFKKEGAAAPSGQVNVFSDIDDTFYRNYKDPRYPEKTIYPGVRRFYAELDKGGAANEDAAGDLIFLSARPYDRVGVFESPIRKMLKEADVHNATVILGDLPHMASDDLMARKKYKNWMQVRQLYPEYGSIFVGDSGQGDAIFGKRALTTENSDMKKVFIHNVTNLDENARAAFAAEGVHIFDTYVGAATEAYKSKLITKEGLQRVADAAKSELAQVRFTSQDQRAAREKDLARDLEAMRAALQ